MNLLVRYTEANLEDNVVGLVISIVSKTRHGAKGLFMSFLADNYFKLRSDPTKSTVTSNL